MSSGLDVLRARVAFRDRAFLDVLDLAVRFLIVHGKVYARTALVTVVPAVLLTLLVGYASSWLAGWLVAIVLGFAVQVPFTVLASRLVFQDEVRARDVLRDALRDLPRVMVMRAAWLAAIGLGGIMVLVPAGWVASATLYVSEVMLLERASIGTALGRAHRISLSSYGDALLGALVTLLLPIAGIVIVELAGSAFITEILQFRGPTPLWVAGGGALSVLGFFAVIPYSATARLFVYLNARTRAEGWDIQTRFAALAARFERDDVEAT